VEWDGLKMTWASCDGTLYRGTRRYLSQLNGPLSRKICLASAHAFYASFPPTAGGRSTLFRTIERVYPGEEGCPVADRCSRAVDACRQTSSPVTSQKPGCEREERRAGNGHKIGPCDLMHFTGADSLAWDNVERTRR
jgi:hypothetical protein